MDKELELRKKLQRILPKAEFRPFTYYKKEGDPPSYIFLTSPNENRQLKGSKYFLKEDIKVVHFTKQASLLSILRNANLRLYNLGSMNDPREFEFAGSIFFDNHELMEHSKESIFSISFCPENILFKNEKKDQFNLWRLYGDNGNGAAIVFKINNSTLEWKDHHLGNVIYGQSRFGVVKGFGGLYQLIQKLNQDEPKINFDFGKFFCFHKSELYSYEKEIRLIFDGRTKKTGVGYSHFKFTDGSEYPTIKEDKTKLHYDRAKFLELRLDKCVQFDEPSIPSLQIEKIILGHSVTIKEYTKLVKQIKDLSQNNLGYIPLIKRSNLTFEYWGKNI